MNNGKLWFETAKKHLKVAEENLNIDQYLVAFQYAIISAEVALKAVLVKNGLFVDKGLPLGDKHHKIPDHFKKIKNRNCLSEETIEKLATVIGDENRGGLGYIRIVTPSGYYMDCTSGQQVLLRYIYKEASPYDMIKEDDAKEKVKEAKHLINILSSFF